MIYYNRTAAVEMVARRLHEAIVKERSIEPLAEELVTDIAERIEDASDGPVVVAMLIAAFSGAVVGFVVGILL